MAAVRLTLRLGLALALLGCGYGEDDTTGLQYRMPVPILVTFNMPSGGSVSATMDGKTYTESPQVVAVQSGVVEISGIFSGNVLDISLGGLDQLAGVDEGSLLNVVGPSPVTRNCGVSFTRSGTGSSSFRVQFNVSTRAGGHC